jgi:hypothetical protein
MNLFSTAEDFSKGPILGTTYSGNVCGGKPCAVSSDIKLVSPTTQPSLPPSIPSQPHTTSISPSFTHVPSQTTHINYPKTSDGKYRDHNNKHKKNYWRYYDYYDWWDPRYYWYYLNNWYNPYYYPVVVNDTTNTTDNTINNNTVQVQDNTDLLKYIIFCLVLFIFFLLIVGRK